MIASLGEIFRSFAEVSWRAAPAIVIVLALRALLRRRIPATMWHVAWVALAARLLVPAAVQVSSPPAGRTASMEYGAAAPLHEGWKLPSEASSLDERLSLAARVSHWAARASEVPLQAWQWAVRELGLAARESAAEHRASIFLHLKTIARPAPGTGVRPALIWFAGAALLFFLRTARVMQFRRRLKHLGDVPAPRIQAVADRVARAMRARPLPVIITDAVVAPALYGLFPTRLLFPSGLADRLSEAALEDIVAHEIAHDLRRDVLAMLLVDLAAMAHWFNPLVWMAGSAARADCEEACDALALRRRPQAEPGHYGRTLLQVVHLTQCGASPPLALGVAETKRHLKRRIEMIVACPRLRAVHVAAVGAILSLAIGISIAAPSRADESAGTAGPYRVQEDHFQALFPDGIVATAGGKTVTVEAVRHEVEAMIPKLEERAHSQEEFNVLLDRARNQVITNQVERALLVREFVGAERHIPAAFVERVMDDELKNKFDGDPAKRDAFLRSRGLTLGQYRSQVEEAIIYDYMRHQERRFQNEPAPTARRKAAPPRQVSIVVSDSGDFQVDGASVSDDELEARLAAIAASSPTADVTIRCSRKTNMAGLTKVMDAANAAGLKRFTLSSPD
jgi:beta-lactamase regulating signal transducer with metallopeptidase domain